MIPPVPLRLASRLIPVKPSVTLAVTARAAELRASGVDVVSFGAGEPDFDTPAHIKDAARAALDRGVGKYTNVAGVIELRRAVASQLGQIHGLELSPAQVLVSTGAKHTLFNLFMALIDPGDEVIIPAPYWVSYPDMVLLAGGSPVILPTRAEDGFAPSPVALAAAMTERTRAVILNTPSNPTGAVYPAEVLREIGELCARRGVLVISDDIYRALVYGGATYTSIARVAPAIAPYLVLVDGVSKTYAMTGWRIGFCAGPQRLIDAMAVIQGQSTTNSTHIAQVAALAALSGSQDCVGAMRAEFDARRLEMVARLRAIPGVSLHEPLGAFYCFPDVSRYLGRRTPDGETVVDDVALVNYLIESARVAVVPGSGFGAPGFVRLSYACSMDDIRTGVDRLAAGLAALAA
ncbi:MAG TPA: pyridoxal phosphate-dependent aminotransferase [Kofleriaceae bacterium]|nr:pyridoxal phosphate-dependent aminotransferase [Kofleriaceae bacterium]